jgi:hypothetical protein
MVWFSQKVQKPRRAMITGMGKGRAGQQRESEGKLA